MDPYSAEGELVNLHNSFHQCRYKDVLQFDCSNLTPTNKLAAKVLQLRAHIALGNPDVVMSTLPSDEDKNTPDMQAVKCLAEFHKARAASKPTSGAVAAAESLAGSQGDNLTVQLLCGTVLAGAGKEEEALKLLARHQGSLDAIALIVQLHLQQNRVDLAAREAQQARKWAQDSLLVNIAESWVGMRQGGEKYQAAYYVFEELAQAPASQSVQSLIGQAVAEIHLGRLPEAEAALQQARELDAENTDLLANSIVLDTILGRTKEAADTMVKMQAASEHPAVSGYVSKTKEFEEACAKYTPKYEV